MILTCWILAVVFGIIEVAFLKKLFLSSINTKETVLLILSIFTTAISVGIIHAGSWRVFIS